MEEVIGSIPIRSTNYFNHFEAPPSTLSHPCRKFQKHTKNRLCFGRLPTFYSCAGRPFA